MLRPELELSYFMESLTLAGLTLPLYGWLLLAVTAGFAFLIRRMPGPRRSWRVAASRRWLARFRRRAHRYTDYQRFEYIRKTDPFLFEDILMTAFEERGYKVRRTPATRDGGADGYVDLDGLQVVVQAKRYRGSIAPAHVHALEFLATRNPKLDRGLFVHTGRTSRPVQEYIRRSPTLDMLSGVSTLLAFLDGKPITLFGRRLRPAKHLARRSSKENRSSSSDVSLRAGNRV